MPASRSFTDHEAYDAERQRRYEAERAAEAAEAVVRRQRANGTGDAPPFAHLSVRSCYSLRDGAIRPRERLIWITDPAANAG